MPSEKCKMMRQVFFGSFSAVAPYPTDDRMCRMVHHHQNNQLPCTRCDHDAALADRRSAHNALERQRREHLNTKFQELAHALPSLQNIRRPSKTMIVSKSLDFVAASIHRETSYMAEILQLRRQNERLRKQASTLSQFLILDDPLAPPSYTTMPDVCYPLTSPTSTAMTEKNSSAQYMC
ncbi:hypothetical protein O0I10_004102 [Lichtheimia ornata]|uniref:BHLH domain-containing protein n=1 Tax=Lichtheimia ornata TaxID=688661 RepID=A0AAD7V983_9FUNG|nr:uncharacterized protein O0I10_004102 [Lichtheimia ornata]KAJ8660242.1 hypothetical protein O0I10_004102 [Lichtheimia ornata]